jgi:hypothetical protein
MKKTTAAALVLTAVLVVSCAPASQQSAEFTATTNGEDLRFEGDGYTLGALASNDGIVLYVWNDTGDKLFVNFDDSTLTYPDGSTDRITTVERAAYNGGPGITTVDDGEYGTIFTTTLDSKLRRELTDPGDTAELELELGIRREAEMFRIVITRQ